uniref:Putative secreted protein n=1 Tax=Anopheles marajoara TaxID=58244 RepID=A0A2M4CED5_9DIPT
MARRGGWRAFKKVFFVLLLNRRSKCCVGRTLTYRWMGRLESWFLCVHCKADNEVSYDDDGTRMRAVKFQF